MLFGRGGDPFLRDYKQLRSCTVSPWAGPKASLNEVELAALKPNGLTSIVRVVTGYEDSLQNCLEAVP
eukprot:6757672-Alexandrium_andersonii.AAC.1